MNSMLVKNLLFFTVLFLLVLGVPNVHAAVTIDDKGYVYIDGNPFFAIGLYSTSIDDLPLIAKNGFNLVHTYLWEGTRQEMNGKNWLDTAHAYGLKALVGLYRDDVKTMRFENLINRIKNFRDHPALLAWHVMDEPGWQKAENRGDRYMPEVYKFVRQYDPNHPVTAVVCHFADVQRFNRFLDILQADYYPIPPIPPENFIGTGFEGIRHYADLVRSTTNGTKPFWYVGQIFDYSTLNSSKKTPSEWKRLPNRDEIRSMTYTAVASGARGILYWSFSRLMGDESQKNKAERMRLWQDLVDVVKELNSLVPLLTSVRTELLTTKNNIASMVKSDGKTMWVIVSNYERTIGEREIEIPGLKKSQVEIVFGECLTINNNIVDGKLRIRLKPLGNAVLRVMVRN